MPSATKLLEFGDAGPDEHGIKAVLDEEGRAVLQAALSGLRFQRPGRPKVQTPAGSGGVERVTLSRAHLSPSGAQLHVRLPGVQTGAVAFFSCAPCKEALRVALVDPGLAGAEAERRIRPHHVQPDARALHAQQRDADHGRRVPGRLPKYPQVTYWGTLGVPFIQL